jgi:hypothetical protein
MLDDVITRMNYDVARDVSRKLTLELLDEIDKLPPPYPPRLKELSEAIRDANKIADRLRRQMILEVAG